MENLISRETAAGLVTAFTEDRVLLGHLGWRVPVASHKFFSYPHSKEPFSAEIKICVHTCTGTIHKYIFSNF